MVEPQIVVLDVAGSNPVDHPSLRLNAVKCEGCRAEAKRRRAERSAAFELRPGKPAFETAFA